MGAVSLPRRAVGPADWEEGLFGVGKFPSWLFKFYILGFFQLYSTPLTERIICIPQTSSLHVYLLTVIGIISHSFRWNEISVAFLTLPSSQLMTNPTGSFSSLLSFHHHWCYPGPGYQLGFVLLGNPGSIPSEIWNQPCMQRAGRDWRKRQGSLEW